MYCVLKSSLFYDNTYLEVQYKVVLNLIIVKILHLKLLNKYFITCEMCFNVFNLFHRAIRILKCSIKSIYKHSVSNF